MGKELYIKHDDKKCLKIIAATVNAKSVQTFLGDLFSAWARNITMGVENEVIELDLTTPRSEKSKVIYLNNEETSIILRIEAVKMDALLAKYLEGIVHWLCNEYRKNGRVWIDDTPVKVLPIRMRR